MGGRYTLCFGDTPNVLWRHAKRDDAKDSVDNRPCRRSSWRDGPIFCLLLMIVQMIVQ
jgi:hypothetical protein